MIWFAASANPDLDLLLASRSLQRRHRLMFLEETSDVRGSELCKPRSSFDGWLSRDEIAAGQCVNRRL